MVTRIKKNTLQILQCQLVRDLGTTENAKNEGYRHKEPVWHKETIQHNFCRNSSWVLKPKFTFQKKNFRWWMICLQTCSPLRRLNQNLWSFKCPSFFSERDDESATTADKWRTSLFPGGSTPGGGLFGCGCAPLYGILWCAVSRYSLCIRGGGSFCNARADHYTSIFSTILLIVPKYLHIWLILGPQTCFNWETEAICKNKKMRIQ